MPNMNDPPLYNIGAVARMTGISVATLRIWERRYQFPTTARSAGRQRLYTEQEITRLRWVKVRVEAGMQVSQAVRALRHQELEPLAATPPPAHLTQPAAETAPLIGSNAAALQPSLAEAREQLYAALLAHEVERADAILSEAAVHYPPEQLIETVIFPMMETVGKEWLAGRLNIATEHLVTNFVRHRMLRWLQHGPPVFPGARPIVLACAPGEMHEGSLIMLGVLLRRRRWPVVYLGQDLPLSDVGLMAREAQAAAVVLVAMTASAAEALAHWPQHLPAADARGRPLVAFGGYIFSTQPGWRERVPGLWLGDSVTEGVEALDRALRQIETTDLERGRLDFSQD